MSRLTEESRDRVREAAADYGGARAQLRMRESGGGSSPDVLRDALLALRRADERLFLVIEALNSEETSR